MSTTASAFFKASARTLTPKPAPLVWVSDALHGWIPALMAVVLLVLTIVPEGFNYGSLSSISAPAVGNPLSRLIWVGLLVSGGLIIVWRARLGAHLLRFINPYLLMFVALVAASVSWSIEPDITARRLIRVVAILVTATAFVLLAWHPLRLQNVVRPVIMSMLLGSLIFGLVRPDLAIHAETSSELIGAWRGLCSQKNGFGSLACIGLIFCVHGGISRELRLLPALLGGAVALSCLMLSRSSTSIAAAIFSVFFLILLLRPTELMRRYMPYVVGLFCAALVVYTVALLDVVPGLDMLLSPISGLTGKDTSLTGRTLIWQLMLDRIGQNPLLGGGYGAFWTGDVAGRPSHEFGVSLKFYPWSAHNGYLEIANDLGLIGVLLLLGYLLHFLVQGLRVLAALHQQGALYLTLLLQQAIANLTETHWLNVLSVNFVIMTLASLSIARLLLEQNFRLQWAAADEAENAEARPGPPAARARLAPTLMSRQP